ncbi:MAG: hypothetical protein BWY76_03103 [bacterium ADurb.Bin429]|nr:MAG: hypothetical protein BWY76_03103 [bacterium ADurb.Bin429]
MDRVLNVSRIVCHAPISRSARYSNSPCDAARSLARTAVRSLSEAVCTVRPQYTHPTQARHDSGALSSVSVSSPSSGKPAAASRARSSAVDGAPYGGTIAGWPSAMAMRLMIASRAIPNACRERTPAALKTSSTGVPSGRRGISVSGAIRLMTPLRPWRLLHLSPASTGIAYCRRAAQDSLMRIASS